MSYDSMKDTKTHIKEVRKVMDKAIDALIKAAVKHDTSKLHTPEKEIFDKVTPKLKGLDYGSAEYKQSLKEMGPALDHHYKNNRHHPEHHENGIDDMTLMDLTEMICDWMAAVKRHDSGDIKKSLEHNKGRFKISPQLLKILTNTVNTLGESEPEEKDDK